MDASLKVPASVGETFKSIDLRNTASAALTGVKSPVKTISSLDKAITKSMRRVVLTNDKGLTENNVSRNIKAYDVMFTKSVKRFVDSVFRNK